MRSALFVASALIGLSACAPQQCDPAQAGFLSGIGCEASGSYAVRNQNQQSMLAQQNAAALQNRAQARDEGARASQALLTRDQARSRLSALDLQTAQIGARLDAAHARGDINQARFDQAKAEMVTLQHQRISLQAGASEQQIKAYEDMHKHMMDDVTGL
jgi:hypothetical protein